MSTSNAPAIEITLPSETELREWLNFEAAGLLQRLQVLGKALARMPTEIADQETAGMVAENVRMATALRGAIDEFTAKHSEPWHTRWKLVTGWKAAITATLDMATTKPKAALLAFAQRQAAAAREEAARAAAEKAQEAALAQARDIFSEEAAQAVQAARKAQEKALAKPAELSHVTGDYGARASITTHWTWRVTNWRLVPEELLALDSGKVRAKMRLGRDRVTGKPTVDIPGIEWVAEETIGVR